MSRHLPVALMTQPQVSGPLFLLHRTFILVVKIGRWSEGFEPGSRLQALVDAAVLGRKPTVSLPQGNFSFGATSLVVSGATGLAVSGAGVGDGGTALWFDPGYGLEVLGCRDVSVGGVSTDLVSPPFSQGALVSVAPPRQQLVIDVEPDFPMADAELFNQRCPDGVGICGEVKTIFWDPTTRQIVQGQPMGMPMANASCDAQTRRCTLTMRAGLAHTPPPGSLVTLSPRFGATKYPIPSYYRGHILVYNSSSVTLHDIDSYSSATMTILENLGGGGHTCVVVPSPHPAIPPSRHPAGAVPCEWLADNMCGAIARLPAPPGLILCRQADC